MKKGLVTVNRLRYTEISKQENKRKTQKQETEINFLQRERINYLQRNNDKTMDNFLTEECKSDDSEGNAKLRKVNSSVTTSRFHIRQFSVFKKTFKFVIILDSITYRFIDLNFFVRCSLTWKFVPIRSLCKETSKTNVAKSY